MSRRDKIQYATIGGVLLPSLLFVTAVTFMPSKSTTVKGSATVGTISITQNKNFSYKGEAGKDALTLLKKQAKTGLDEAGMVNAINGRKADLSKHEYWAFYVNGKMTSVGPAAYITKQSDKIEWKIERY